jgi:ABC-2 type transport system permease protein
MDAKKMWGRYIKFFIYLTLVVLVNAAGLTLFFRADLTANKIFSLSEVSRQVVSTLSEPLTIKVFFTKDLPAPYNNAERYLRDLLEEYGVHANRHFNYRFYDVSPDEGDLHSKAKENREIASNYGIQPVQIQAFHKDQIKFQNAYMGLVLIHGDIIERLPALVTTDGLEYQLTTAIQKLNNKVSALLALPDQVRVRLYLSSSLDTVAPLLQLNDLSGLPKKLGEVAQRLNGKNYGKLHFEHLDPTMDQELEKAADKFNLLTLKWPAIPERGVQPGKGIVGLVMEYGSKGVEIPVVRVLRIPIIGTRYEMAGLEELEEAMNSGLESLIDINEDLGYLADHGTFSLAGASPSGPMAGQQDDGITNFKKTISLNYTLKPVHLDSGIPSEGFQTLVIARPTGKFSDYELYQIDQLLMRGKNLAIFLDAFKEEFPPPNSPMAFQQGPLYLPLATGLERLLEHYGVRIGGSYVLDENCFSQELPAQMGGGERPIYFAPVIKNQFINNGMTFMRNIKGLVAFKISPLELVAERIAQNGLTAHRLFSSSEKSWEMSGMINLNPMFIQPPLGEGEQRSMPLAYLLEGEFPSYFEGKPIPEKGSPEEPTAGSKEQESGAPKEEVDPETRVSSGPVIEGEGDFVSRGKPAKIFLMASSAMIQDNVMDEEGRTPNAAFIMNVIDSLNNREGVALMRSKEQHFNPLMETTAGVKTFIKSFNIAGLPVLVVLFGFLVWARRLSRKRRIQSMFQKQERTQ